MDDHALACLRLHLFAPLTELCELAPHKAWELTDVIRQRFPVPRSWLNEAARTITGTATREEPLLSWSAVHTRGWVAVRIALGRAIQASATPQRLDRLFPGDPAQFATGGVNIAHGAAGVLYVLSVTGIGHRPAFEQWLVDQATQPVRGSRLGFYDGLHGVAYVLHHLGRRQLALDLLDRCLAAPWEDVGYTLHDGLTGMALNFAHFAQETGETPLHCAAVRAAEMVAGRLESTDRGAEVSGSESSRAGLMRGSAGPALLFLRLYETTGETAWLDHASLALYQDLRCCFTRDGNGALQVNDGLEPPESTEGTEKHAAPGSPGLADRAV